MRLEAAEVMANKLLNLNQGVLLELAKRLATEKALDGAEIQNLIGKNLNTAVP
jgi:hypothetical protein